MEYLLFFIIYLLLIENYCGSPTKALDSTVMFQREEKGKRNEHESTTREMCLILKITFFITLDT